jgi:hypothetical protein
MKRTALRRRRSEPRRRAAPRFTVWEWELASEALYRRSGGRCDWCGSQLRNDAARHHRLRRRDGGDRLANLVLLHTSCHRWVHANPVLARGNGFIVRTGADPADVPLYRGYHKGWVKLDDDGSATPTEPLEMSDR